MSPKLQTLHRTAKGLYSQLNKIHGIPEGGLLEAQNVTIDRTGVIEKIRGRNRFGTVAASQVKQLFEFRDRLIRHVGTSLEYDSDGSGTFLALTGTFSAPDSLHRIRAIESLLNLYFTTSKGVFKKATLTDDPVRSGIHEGLDLQLSLVGTGAGMFNVDSQVAYRIVFGRRDANNKLLLGAPTPREVATNIITTGLAWTNVGALVSVVQTAHGYTTGDIIEISASTDAILNGPQTITVTGANGYDFTASSAPSGPGTLSAGKKFNVTITATIPTDIVAGDFYQVYRTTFSASQTTSPGDEAQLVKEIAIVAADITAGTVTFTDTLDAAFLGEPLYTNATIEGAASENSRPPFAKDICLWKGHVWALNTTRAHRRTIQFIDSSGLTTGTSAITITDGTTTRTYTFETAESIPAQEFQLFTAEATEAQNIEKTMESFVRVVNRDTGQSVWEARYVSGEDDAPGFVEVRMRELETAAFSLTVDATSTGDNFSPTLPTSGASVSSDKLTRGNGLARSKFERSEAFPIANVDPVGDESRVGLRCMSLRDSLILLMEKGIYRVSGESDGLNGETFVITELDPSVQVVAPDAAIVLNNAVYCLSTQGVLRIDESGTDIVSYQIEDDLKTLFAISGYEALTFSVPYESDRKMLLYVPEAATDTAPTLTRVYNYLNNTWTERAKAISAAHILLSQDRLYEAHNTDLFVLEERKSFNANSDDYLDETIAATVTAFGTTTNPQGATVSTVTVTFTYTTVALSTGWLFEQGFEEGIVEAISDLGSNSFLLTLDNLLVNPVTGACTLSIPIQSRVRWRPESAQNPAINKQFPEVALYMEANTALLHRVGFSSDVDANETFVTDIRVGPGFGWGEGPWGEFGWGDEGELPSTPIRVPVPRQFQRCRVLNVIYEHNRAKERFAIASLAYTARPYGERTTRTPR